MTLTKDNQKRFEVSIVIPCLNEVETIERVVKGILDNNSQAEYSFEIIVSDNGSDDGSLEVLAQLPVTIVNAKMRGYGAALTAGIEAASGDYIVMGDADDSYELENFSKFIAPLNQGSDMVIGNRFRGEIQPGAMPILHKWIGNPGLSLLGRLFFKVDIGDFHCGIRSFKRSEFLNLEIHAQGMEFATEMIAKASHQGLRITEIPTVLRKDGRSRPPHLNTWRDGWRHLKFMLAYAPDWSFLYPGIFLALMGSLIVLLDSTGSLNLLGRPIGAIGIITGVLFFLFGLIMLIIGMICSKVIYRVSTHRELRTITRLGLILQSSIFSKLTMTSQLIVTLWFLGLIQSWLDGRLDSTNELTRIKFGLVFLMITLSNFLIFVFNIVDYFLKRELKARH